MTAPQPYAPQYGPPPSGIAITTKYSFLAWLYAVVKPKIYLNGYEVPVMGWGRTFLPTAPGQYHVHVYTPYWFPSRVGPADYSVVVHPGHLVELEYKAPVFTFVRGSLGPPPQRYNGMGATIALVAIVVLMFALATVAMLAAR
jgi:hypothetical protein